MDQDTRSVPDARSCDQVFACACEQQMEAEMLTHGKSRFEQSVHTSKTKGRESNTRAGLLALRDSIEPVALAIEKFVTEAKAANTRPQNQHVSIKIFEEVGFEEAALLTSKAIIDNLSAKTSSMKMSLKIAGMFLDELRYRKFKAAAPGLFEWKLRTFDTTSYQHMKRSLDASMHFAGIDVSEYQMSDSHRILVGAKALDIFVRSTHKIHTQEDGTTVCEYCANNGYVQIERVTNGRAVGNETNVIATEATIAWIRTVEDALMFMAPTYRPTLIKPKPWTNSWDGGYWFALSNTKKFTRFPLLRTDGRHKMKDLDNVDMPVVYEALNALQDTSWRINERIFEVVEKFRSMNHRPPNDVLPSEFKEPEPPKPPIMQVDKDTEDMLRTLGAVLHENKRREKEGSPLKTWTPLPAGWDMSRAAEYWAAVKAWRKKAAEIHNRNHTRLMQAHGLTQTIATAKIMLGATDADGNALPFYFPHNLDFRGRAYAIPLFLQPQGDDLQKGLLQFGVGRELGSADAADWLAIHGANCLADAPGGLKLDKLPFADRIQWVRDHSDAIRGVAEDPIENTWWTAADSPFCFLAFCFEWAGYLRDGLKHVSHLPVAMDGSCNGLQHYSALLRDEVGGRAVNLVPSETPQDIYAKVAEKVITILRTKITDPLAADWLRWGKINRKFVKRQVMTLPYGSKKFGFKGQIKEFVKGLEKSEQPVFMDSEEDKNGFNHLNYIANVIWDALAGTVTAATNGMEWLQSLARICAKEDLPICWTAPNGLPVVQGYRQENKKRVFTTLVDLEFAPTYLEATSALDLNKQVNGIAPNVIHSLDASAMMLTVCAAKASGLTHFAMIHDSYGTHAADAAQLARITREQFVKMYTENDVLQTVEDGLMANVDVSKVKKYPVRPAVGSLDLACVTESKYFFS